jgi:hypothetical protein
MVNNRPFVPSQAVQRPNIAKRLEELAGWPSQMLAYVAADHADTYPI